MENASLEFDCAIDDAGQTIQQIEVLADLQLALVGGGCGETVFHQVISAAQQLEEKANGYLRTQETGA